MLVNTHERVSVGLIFCHFNLFSICLLVNFGRLGAPEEPKGLQMNTGLNPVVDQRQRTIFGDLGGFSTSE